MSEAAVASSRMGGAANVGGVPTSAILTVSLFVAALVFQYLVCAYFLKRYRRAVLAPQSEENVEAEIASTADDIREYAAPASSSGPPSATAPTPASSRPRQVAQGVDAEPEAQQPRQVMFDEPGKVLRALSLNIGESISESFHKVRDWANPRSPIRAQRRSAPSVFEYAGATSAAAGSDESAPHGAHSKDRPPHEGRRAGRKGTRHSSSAKLHGDSSSSAAQMETGGQMEGHGRRKHRKHRKRGELADGREQCSDGTAVCDGRERGAHASSSAAAAARDDPEGGGGEGLTAAGLRQHHSAPHMAPHDSPSESMIAHRGGRHKSRGVRGQTDDDTTQHV